MKAQEPSAIRAITLQKSHTLCSTICGQNEYFAAGLSSGNVNFFPFDKAERIIRIKAHDGAVRNIQYSQNIDIIATGSEDGTVRLWDYRNQKQIRSISIGGPLIAMHLDKSFNKLVTVTEDNKITLWNPLAGSKIVDIKTPEKLVISTCCITEEGSIFIGYTNGTLQTFDTRAGIVTSSIKVESAITALATNESTVAIGCKSGSVIFLDINTQNITGRSNSRQKTITSLDFNPNGNILCIASKDTTISFIETSTMNMIFTLNCYLVPVTWIRFSADGAAFTSCGEDNRVILWKFPISQSELSEEDEYEEIVHELEKRPTKEDENENPSQQQRFISMIHNITDQIVSLSTTVSNLEKRMQEMDEQISYLENVKRKQAKDAINAANLQ